MSGCRRLTAATWLGWDLLWEIAGLCLFVSARERELLLLHLGTGITAVCCSEQLLEKMLVKSVVKRTKHSFQLPEKLVCLPLPSLLKCYLLPSLSASVSLEMLHSLLARAFEPRGDVIFTAH